MTQAGVARSSYDAFSHRLLSPRADPGEARWRSSGDIARDAAHLRGRVLGAWPEVQWGQALQKRHRAAICHSRTTVNDQVFSQSLFVRFVAKYRERNSGVTANVFDFLVQSQMAHDEFVAFNADPHYCHLRPAVRTERNEMSEGSFFNYFSD